MDKSLKDKILTLGIMVVVVLLYFAVSESLLYRDIFLRNFSEMDLNIMLFLQLLLFASSVGMLFINAYGYSIFKESRNLLIALALFLNIIAIGIGVIISVNEQLFITSLDRASAAEMIQLLGLAIIAILLLKLIVVRQDFFSSIPLRFVPILFGVTLLLLAGIYWYFSRGEAGEDLSLVLLYILVFLYFVGYGYKYMLDGDPISRDLLFIGLIHAVTILPGAGLPQDPYRTVIGLLFRVISFFYLLNTFYKHLFTSYLKELEMMNSQRDAYTQGLQRIVEEKTQDLQEANRILEGEIDSAKRLQQSLLPPEEVVFSGASFVSRNIPCERLSGDFYDIYTIDKNKVGMYILDVSGHGINAALMNIYCYQYIRSTSPLIKRFLGDKPHRNLNYLYEEFNKMNFPDDMHIVMMIASYDMAMGTLTFSSGGLNTQPLLVRENGEIRLLSAEPGFPISKLGEFYVPEYKSVNVQLFQGDRILFYTDGLLDERQGIDLTLEDLELILLSTLDESLSAADEAIYARIRDTETELVDDISYFLMQVN